MSGTVRSQSVDSSITWEAGILGATWEDNFLPTDISLTYQKLSYNPGLYAIRSHPSKTDVYHRMSIRGGTLNLDLKSTQTALREHVSQSGIFYELSFGRQSRVSKRWYRWYYFNDVSIRANRYQTNFDKDFNYPKYVPILDTLISSTRSFSGRLLSISTSNGIGYGFKVFKSLQIRFEANLIIGMAYNNFDETWTRSTVDQSHINHWQTKELLATLSVNPVSRLCIGYKFKQ